MKLILCAGQEWRGSNSSGLFNSLSALGYITHIINVKQYISTNGFTLFDRTVNKLVHLSQIRLYNKSLYISVKNIRPDLLLLYKGSFINPETLFRIRQDFNVPIVLFYPDIDFKGQKSVSINILKYIDAVYSTKSFGLSKLKEVGYEAHFKYIPHGFDLNVHRTMNGTPERFQSDISFTGNFSSKKLNVISNLFNQVPDFETKIWGNGWTSFRDCFLRQSTVQGYATVGDTYVASINGSKINLGVLSESLENDSEQDQITSRTFHIPGSGGFLLHERTEEFLSYFEAGVEAETYSSNEEILSKTLFYMKNSAARNKIANRGYERAHKQHSLKKRAEMMISDLVLQGML